MADLTLVIGNKNYSSWSLRAWIFLRHFQIEFTEQKVLLFTSSTDAELAKFNSNFKVPILLDGDLTVWDSLAILEYVSEQYLGGAGWPKNAKKRAVARAISAEMHASFMDLRNALPMNCRKSFQNVELSAQTERDIARISALWRDCRQNYGQDGEWLFGQYSIADAMFAPIALRFSGYNIALDSVAQTYVKSVLNQPEIVQWIAAGKLETAIIQADEI